MYSPLLPTGIALMFIMGVASLPPPVEQQAVPFAGYEKTFEVRRSRREAIPKTFPRLYVHRNGTISDSSEDEQLTIELYASPLSSTNSLNRAAVIVSKMVAHMPLQIFKNLAQSGAGAGVYTWQEKATIYPDYAVYRDTPECRGSCKGDCAMTCLTDGRKIDSLPGLGGAIGAIVEDNVLCTKGDPYHHKENVLIHEFAHTIKDCGHTEALQNQVDKAFEEAKEKKTWMSNGYAMHNSQEYWASASQVFMGVHLFKAWNAAGMNLCHGEKGPFCNEAEGRLRLKQKDPVLYDALVKTYTNGDPDLPLGLKICP